MKKAFLIILSIFYTTSNLCSNRPEGQDQGENNGSILWIDFHTDLENFNLFIAESGNLPGRIAWQSNPDLIPHFILFRFNGHYTHEEIQNLINQNITAQHYQLTFQVNP
jgi:hypothetical protein